MPPNQLVQFGDAPTFSVQVLVIAAGVFIALAPSDITLPFDCTQFLYDLIPLVANLVERGNSDSYAAVIWCGNGSTFEVCTAIIGSKRNARSMRLASQAS